MALTPTQLLAQFRRQVRLADRDVDPTSVLEHDGLVRRSYPADPTQDGAMIESPQGLGRSDTQIEAAIERQVCFFQDRGQRVEWKTYADDAPADLVMRLARRGFVVEDQEVLLLGVTRDLIREVPVPAGLAVREFSSAADWDRVGTFLETIWGTGRAWVNQALRAEQAHNPTLFRPVLVEETGGAGRVVSYAALRLTPGCDFAGLWGGSTLPEYRRRGIYRALTAYRARVALDAGAPYVRVDTSPDSRPILLGLGMHSVTTTTPCILDPTA